MEGELIVVSLITSIFGMAGIILLNHTWEKRQEVKYKYKLKEIKLRQSAGESKRQAEQNTNPPNLLNNLLGLVKNNPELVSRFLGEAGQEMPMDTDDLGNMIVNFAKDNPEIVQGFLSGLKNKGGQNEQEAPSQI